MSPNIHTALERDLEQTFLAHPVRHHLFLELFREGKLTKSQIKKYFEQQYYLSVNFPSTIAAIYARVPDKYWKEKRNIIDLINVEAWGSNSSAAHDTHFRDVCGFLDIDIEKLRTDDPRPYTLNYLNDRMDLYLHYPIQTALAGVAYNEKLFRHIIQKMNDGLTRTKGMTDIPKTYFEMHLRDEVHDFELFKEIMQLTVENEQEIKNAAQGVQKILDIRNQFFDGLVADIMHL